MSLRPRRPALPCFALAAALIAVAAAAPAHAATAAPDLATAGSFAVLAATTVTNTGPSTVSGDVGVSPGTAITGFGPGTVTAGTFHSADAVALQAQRDLTAAYDSAAGLPPSAAVTADLAGQRLVPGVYAGPTLSLTGALSLDAGGDPDAVFVFQSASTLVTGSASSVLLLGGATPCNVFWQVGSSATLGTGSTFVGSVLALASVTANTGAAVQGRLLARQGAVTLDTNTVVRPLCAAAATSSTATATPSAATAAPVPSASSGPVTAAPAEAAPLPGPAAAAPAAATPTVVVAPEQTAAPVPVVAEPMPPAPSPSPPPTPPASSPGVSSPATPPPPAVSRPGSSTRQPAGADDSSTALAVPETVTGPQAAPPADLTQQVVGGEPPPTLVELPRTGAPVRALVSLAVLLMTFGLLCLLAAGPAVARPSRLQGISSGSAA